MSPINSDQSESYEKAATLGNHLKGIVNLNFPKTHHVGRILMASLLKGFHKWGIRFPKSLTTNLYFAVILEKTRR